MSLRALFSLLLCCFLVSACNKDEVPSREEQLLGKWNIVESRIKVYKTHNGSQTVYVDNTSSFEKGKFTKELLEGGVYIENTNSTSTWELIDKGNKLKFTSDARFTYEIVLLSGTTLKLYRKYTFPSTNTDIHTEEETILLERM
ncbi:hypothetical protein ABID22_002931 [Pontibacter aydingkolensis]|uniref:Lipocalin-like domain-containing protein n=1 Tax=Pontibacter aydingkolensis TaxID=1911536 RepID=A0ABS7CXF1_9BACT|nr:hypothetical protein [Pontibacter aydingkolensis]MBW7468514.1 hypothetical protein [Pontibacter aydingkolensis]